MIAFLAIMIETPDVAFLCAVYWQTCAYQGVSRCRHNLS